MGGRVREYETTFIIQPEISDEGIAELHARIDALLERKKARRLLYDDMGRRKLAYDIRKFQKGHYWTLFFLDDGGVVPELERMLRLEESVLRYLTVMANEEVGDIDARVAEAAEQERIRAQKAAERAAREAEEAAAAAAAEEGDDSGDDERDDSDDDDTDSERED
jgi:small subunit ribosomal protein S6